ncbi:hypothetical protein C4564_01450 [Candidatus Microgenomates bacterium]|nr:MAG: hypothetical protein C4564_01450 [Candidatus Microgenomates bacterium]
MTLGYTHIHTPTLMKQSKLLPKTLKQPPQDADTLNHKLLVQAGFVRQTMAGVYTYMPLGLRVLNKIRSVIREEMDSVGGLEIAMPALHPSANWKQTGGWDKVDVLFKLQSRTGKEYALGQSHEEIVTPLAKELINSYRDLPLALYQIGWKYRDELRAKSGILRGREFEMKDMYSFHESQEDFEGFYEDVKKAYLSAFKKVGLTAKVTEASGGAFTDKISYEFMVLTDAGEDDILYCPACEFCINTEITKEDKEGGKCPKCGKENLAKARASEVGNVFDLEQKFVRAFDLKFVNKNGESAYPVMGCYGWGTTRTLGVVVEKYNDDKGIIWPETIAPFAVHLIELPGGKNAKAIYDKLVEQNIEVLWDDRDASAGEKFSDADLIGIPHRIVVSAKTGDMIEHKRRDSEKINTITISELLQLL